MDTLSRMRFRRERGQSVVETALVVPLLLLLVVGVADLGRAFYSYIIITNASREGARYASRFPWLAANIRAAVIAEAAGYGVPLTDDNITIDPEPGGDLPGSPNVAQRGDTITVTVQVSFQTILGGIVGLDELKLTGQTAMIVFGAD